jgi:hypothetical protein
MGSAFSIKFQIPVIDKGSGESDRELPSGFSLAKIIFFCTCFTTQYTLSM